MTTQPAHADTAGYSYSTQCAVTLINLMTPATRLRDVWGLLRKMTPAGQRAPALWRLLVYRNARSSVLAKAQWGAR